MKNLLLAGVTLIFLPMIAQDGSPDLSFGDNGIVQTQIYMGITDVVYGVHETSNYSLTDISGKLIPTGVIDQVTYALDLTRFEAGMCFLNIDQQPYKLLKN